MVTRRTLRVTDVERSDLERLARLQGTLADRCKVVLLNEQELTCAQIGENIDMREQTVLKLRNRFLKHRLAGLKDKPWPGAKRTIGADKIAEVVRMTVEEKPPDAMQYSLRGMAAASGISRSIVNTIWRAHNLQLHRSETFKQSRDPSFIEKLRDVVGLYISPPENAVVLCVDEKSQMQALDRTHMLSPMPPGQVERRTHDYVRHGTSSLYAVLMGKTGVVI